ncbi:hypothetical protein AMTR_s00062p00203010 [Amborella trichopoda]|uniref:Uncharacterized protein n=1 Tax=Amborella trichopoda TaxID=13333 RepID=U5DBX5_AMBTC|nr:hypothetical protein AMTR_s00062p00203010 [Amborella trichopoda]
MRDSGGWAAQHLRVVAMPFRSKVVPRVSLLIHREPAMSFRLEVLPCVSLLIRQELVICDIIRAVLSGFVENRRFVISYERFLPVCDVIPGL